MKTGDKQFAVIGLGRFGLAVCKELQDSGSQVLAVDINEDRVKEAAGFVSQAIVANCTHDRRDDHWPYWAFDARIYVSETRANLD